MNSPGLRKERDRPGHPPSFAWTLPGIRGYYRRNSHCACLRRHTRTPVRMVPVMSLRSSHHWPIFMRRACLAVAVLVSVARAQWNEKVLYSFKGIPDGAVPSGGVVFDKAGNLYGATGDGGSSACDGPGQCGTAGWPSLSRSLRRLGLLARSATTNIGTDSTRGGPAYRVLYEGWGF